MRGPNDKDLKFTPYWWEAAPLGTEPSAVLPRRADVAIVGAGFTGLSAAITLARAGRSVVVFDGQRAGEGASSRNGGICSGNVKYPFGALVDKVGLERAKTVYAEGIAAREYLANFISSENIDCGFKLVGRFTGANNQKAYTRMGAEADLLNRHFDLGVEMVPRPDQHRELGTDFYHGGQVRPDIGGVHPGLLHRGMYDCALNAGAAVRTLTEVTRVTGNAGDFTLHAGHLQIQVRDVVVATNGYTGALTPWLRRRVVPVPSQIIATETLGKEVLDRLMPKRRMLGDTRNLYNYYRPSPDDSRIIFGGRRGADTDDPRKKCAHLYANLIEIFPQLEGVGLTHSWWGYTGYSFDFFPHVTVHEGIHYATAYCGSGVVWAPWLGRKAALDILGEPGSESVFESFPFSTRPLYFGRPWFLPFTIAWYGLKDRFGVDRI